MRKFRFITVALMASVFFSKYCFAGYDLWQWELNNNLITTQYSRPKVPDYTDEIVSIIKKIKPSTVFAVVNTDAPLHKSDTTASEIVKIIQASSELELLSDKTMAWYYVLEPETNEVGWIEGKYLNIPKEEPINEIPLTTAEIEKYINILGFCSKTENFVFVDIERQKVYVLSGMKNNWKHVKTITCSTGKNESPTIRGLFEITDRGVWFYSERLKSGAEYWVRFHGTYLFHTLPMDRNRNIIDTTLGEKCSNGCVRMSPGDAKWFYNNIQDKTAVFIV